MNELAIAQNSLPTTIEDLSRFALVGREKIVAVRAEIRAIDKLGLAGEVRQQKLDEAQMISEAVLDAEVKIGALTAQMPKASGARTDIKPTDSGVARLPKREAIKELGFTTKQVERFEQLAKNPEMVEKAKAEARDNDDIVSRTLVLEKIKQAKRKADIEQQIEVIEKGIEKPEGLFDVIAIDPPWNYGTQFNSSGRRVASPYPEMTQDELKAINIPAAENSVMFLWTTHKFIWDAKELLDAWGFEYRSMLVWNKQKIGMGDLIRMQCEFCLVGMRGKPIFRDNHSIRDIIEEPRREHSRKPEAFYNLVDTLCVGRKLDYFSREQREGWWCYGNDAAKF